MELDLQGRTAVVTGASRGIGLAIAQALITEGVTVVAGARSTTPALAELVTAGGAIAVEVDLTAPMGPERLVGAAPGPIDIVVNNVGNAPARPGGFLSVTDDQWLATLGLNLMPAVRTVRAALPGMLEAGRGSIITVCSVNSTLADPMVIDYGAAKAALANFSKALSKEVGPKGVRVNTVSPGPVATDLWLSDHGVAAAVASATGTRPEDVAAGAAHQSPTGRFSRPDEVADLVVLLASDRTANVTGADFTIDGGLVPTW